MKHAPAAPAAPAPGPLSAPPPEPARFDPRAGAWIFSRYDDVLAALREPVLRQDIRGGDRPRGRPDLTLPPAELHDWQIRAADLARARFAQLPSGTCIDLRGAWIEPWTADLALCRIFGDAWSRRPSAVACSFLAPYASGAAFESRLAVLETRAQRARDLAGPSHEPLLRRAAMRARALGCSLRFSAARACNAISRSAAGALMRPLVPSGGSGEGPSLLIGLTQTLPGFLAGACVAALENPDEFANLRTRPEALSRAVEELLRYAGMVHTLHRRAAADVRLGGVPIRRGDRVLLMLASANRDPRRFAAPDRLDLERRSAGQLALGAGPHACAGASLVRAAAAALLRVLLENLDALHPAAAPEWRRGPTLVSPARIPVILDRASASAAGRP